MLTDLKYNLKHINRFYNKGSNKLEIDLNKITSYITRKNKGLGNSLIFLKPNDYLALFNEYYGSYYCKELDKELENLLDSKYKITSQLTLDTITIFVEPI